MPAHAKTALETARRGCVLLKNEGGLLPLDLKNGKLCVVGPCAFPTPTGGGGAAAVKAFDPKSVLGSLLELAPELKIRADERYMAESDAVIVCAGLDAKIEHEGSDRPFELPWEQVALIHRAIEANKNVIVVLTIGGGVGMATWIDGVKAVLHAWYPGGNGAFAVAEILLGKVNPSGKLPVSIERKWSDSAAFANYIPEGGAYYEAPDYNSLCRPLFEVRYEEGLFTGYRHFDKKGVEPLFPFGHGLSYTKFVYSSLKISRKAGKGATVSFKIKNSGKMTGAEVAQVYLGSVKVQPEDPVKELKGFARVELKPGETKSVTVELDERAFQRYDVKAKGWRPKKAPFLVMVGASSKAIHLEGSLK
jgi:beta-glucosidase